MSMTRVTPEGVSPYVQDPYEIGWYIESADEDVYGPVSRKTVRRLLADKTISPNTLVRHCTQPEAAPAADQRLLREPPGAEVKEAAGWDLFGADLDGGPLPAGGDGPVVGDRLADAWPRRGRDQRALAEDSLPCAWHNRPAVLVCVRCHAPYCNKCRAKPFKKQFFLCKKCQAGQWNRRFWALVLDGLILVQIPTIAAQFALIAMGEAEGRTAMLALGVLNVICVALIFGRDVLFGGAGIGKRAAGLRVVQARDGMTPLTFGQGIVRWLSQLIPIFNLVDAAAAYSDPLLRRYGDRWAGTRVIDTEKKLARDRQRVARRLLKRAVQLPPQFGMTMEDLAREA